MSKWTIWEGHREHERACGIFNKINIYLDHLHLTPTRVVPIMLVLFLEFMMNNQEQYYY